MDKKEIRVVKTVLVLGGLPGSGKSTEAKRLARKHLKESGEEATICSADHFFEDEEGNYEFNPGLIGKAHEACLAKFVRALEAEVGLVIVDNTNTQKWEFQRYVELGNEHGYTVELDRKPCPDEKTLRGWHKRCVHNVPLKHVFEMWKRWDA